MPMNKTALLNYMVRPYSWRHHIPWPHSARKSSQNWTGSSCPIDSPSQKCHKDCLESCLQQSYSAADPVELYQLSKQQRQVFRRPTNCFLIRFDTHSTLGFMAVTRITHQKYYDWGGHMPLWGSYCSCSEVYVMDPSNFLLSHYVYDHRLVQLSTLVREALQSAIVRTEIKLVPTVGVEDCWKSNQNWDNYAIPPFPGEH